MFGYYEKYNCSQHNIDFPSPEEVIDRIHAAGGYAILAHPGEYIKNLPNIEVKDILNSFASKGIDGIECYYPRHSPEITNKCLYWCNKRNMSITGGSDYHGSFAGNPIDSIRILKNEFKLDLIN